jgi:retron-type reverse transcriptase
VKAFLKAGVLTDLGDQEESPTGIPQGGILSPLLANIEPLPTWMITPACVRRGVATNE